MENYIVCPCLDISVNDIVSAMKGHSRGDDIMEVYKDVREKTGCVTVCGQCEDEVISVIKKALEEM